MGNWEIAELIRIALAGAYIWFALVLLSFPGKASMMRGALILTAIVASAITMWNTLGHRIAPFPALLTLIFVVVLIHGTLMFKDGRLSLQEEDEDDD
jgi:hypothetical protein